MITFTISPEDRRRAQYRAAELDLCLSDPPGRPPYVWDNRQNCVKRWYDYAAGENKIGTIYFEPVVGKNGEPSGEFRCTTEITWHPADRLRETKIADEEEHRRLVGFFFEEPRITEEQRFVSSASHSPPHHMS